MTCTLLLRGGAEQFIAEVERSLHDAIMIVKRAIKNNQVVAGGGATEVSLSLLLSVTSLMIRTNDRWKYRNTSEISRARSKESNN